MNDDVIGQFDRGYLEVARRLEAYADLRLTPRLAATTAMRASVMQAAHRRAALIQADPTLVAVPATAPVPVERLRTTPRRWHRPAGALLAASLTIGIAVGTVSAASPSGPLYAARLWIEMSNLPADPIARADAELARLQDRLREAQQASTVGDGPAAEAALAAYSAILFEAEQGSSGDAAASDAIEGGVTRHVAVLTALLEVVPATARDAVEHALASSTKFLDDHRTNGAGTGGENGTRPAQPGQPGGNGGAGPGAQPAKPAATERPEKASPTPRPVKPSPTHPVKPEKTIAPTKPVNGQGQGAGD